MSGGMREEGKKKERGKRKEEGEREKERTNIRGCRGVRSKTMEMISSSYPSQNGLLSTP